MPMRIAVYLARSASNLRGLRCARDAHAIQPGCTGRVQNAGRALLDSSVLARDRRLRAESQWGWSGSPAAARGWPLARAGGLEQGCYAIFRVADATGRLWIKSWADFLRRGRVRQPRVTDFDSCFARITNMLDTIRNAVTSDGTGTYKRYARCHVTRIGRAEKLRHRTGVFFVLRPELQDMVKQKFLGTRSSS